MRINFFKTSIAVLAAALMALLAWSNGVDDTHKAVAAGTTFVVVAATAVMAFGADYNLGARTVNVTVSAFLMLLLALVSNVVTSYFAFNNILYIVLEGLLLCVALLTNYCLVGRSSKG